MIIRQYLEWKARSDAAAKEVLHAYPSRFTPSPAQRADTSPSSNGHYSEVEVVLATAVLAGAPPRDEFDELS